MSLIVAGTFSTSADAERALSALLQSGINRSLVCSFAVNPTGQHAGYSAAGDHDAPTGTHPAARQAGKSAGIGGAVGLGVRSLAGALNGMDNGENTSRENSETGEEAARAAGVLVAVNASQSAVEELAIRVLRKSDAQDIEQALGVWRNGTWENFDPTSAPHRIALPA
jgi:hypothetical protein